MAKSIAETLNEVATQHNVPDEPDGMPPADDIDVAVVAAADAPEEAAEGTRDDAPKAETRAEKPAVAVVEDDIDPPNEWTAAEQDFFRKQGKDVKDHLLNWHKRQTEERQKYDGELTRWKRTYEPVDEILAPVRDAIRTNGMTEAQYVASLHHASQWLARDPAGFIRHMAQTKGVDLRMLVQPEPQAAAEEEYIDPTVRAMRDEFRAELAKRDELLQRLSGGFNGYQQQAAQAVQAQVTSEIEQFAAATDESGKPLHPHFNEVKYDMGLMMTAGEHRGQSLTLKDAYERAVRANPETWAKLQSAQQAADRRRADQDARERSEKAKRAGSSVAGEGSGMMSPVPPTKNLAALLAYVADKHGASA